MCYMKRNMIPCLVSVALLSSCANKTIETEEKTVDGWPNQPSPKLKAEFLRRAFPTDTTSILNNSRRFYLLSLDPGGDTEGKNSFHGYEVLGKTRIKNRKQKSSLLTALYQDVAKSAHSRDGVSPAKTCFFPRHGIQSTQGSKFVDLVICFKCSQFRLYTNGKRGGSTILGVSGKLFNQTLKQAGIRMAAE